MIKKIAGQSKVKIQKRARAPNDTKHYVDKAKLFQAMCEYKQSIYKARELGLEKPRIPPYIGECIFLITKKIATLRNFAGYTFREEMEGDGFENVCKYLDNFDEVKYSNPYSYITQIVMFAFIRRIKAEKRQLYVKQKSLENTYMFGILEEGQMLGINMEAQLAGDMDNEYMSNLVIEFEKKIAEKKQQQLDKKNNKKHEDENE